MYDVWCKGLTTLHLLVLWMNNLILSSLLTAECFTGKWVLFLGPQVDLRLYYALVALHVSWKNSHSVRAHTCKRDLTAESFFRIVSFLSWSRNFPHLLEPKGSLPCSQQPAVCPCRGLNPILSTPAPPPSFCLINFNIIISSPRGVLSSGLPTKSPYVSHARLISFLIWSPR
jgi:hypothetical protein